MHGNKNAKLNNAVFVTQYGQLAAAGFRRPFGWVFIIRRCVAGRRGWTGLDLLAFKSRVITLKLRMTGGGSVKVPGRTRHAVGQTLCIVGAFWYNTNYQ